MPQHLLNREAVSGQGLFISTAGGQCFYFPEWTVVPDSVDKQITLGKAHNAPKLPWVGLFWWVLVVWGWLVWGFCFGFVRGWCCLCVLPAGVISRYHVAGTAHSQRSQNHVVSAMIYKTSWCFHDQTLKANAVIRAIFYLFFCFGNKLPLASFIH